MKVVSMVNMCGNNFSLFLGKVLPGVAALTDDA